MSIGKSLLLTAAEIAVISWYLMISIGMLHAGLIPALPAFGFWQVVPIAIMVSVCHSVLGFFDDIRKEFRK